MSNADDPVAPKIGAPRLSRAALVLAGTAAVAACGKNTDTPDSGRIREPDVYVAAPPYGAVPTEQPDPEPPPPPPLDAGRKIHAPPYGMPPRRDAGKRRPGDPFDDF